MKTRKDNGEKRVNYQDALVFIGEVRSGISWERFCMQAIKNFDTFIDYLNDTQEAREFLAQRRIEPGYVTENLDKILERLYFNPENDYYLTLGLSHNATGEQIHDRWKSLMVLYHPDRNRTKGMDGSRCASKINEVYSVLKDSGKKKAYDRRILRNKPSTVRPPGGMTKTTGPGEIMRKHYVMTSSLRRMLSRIILPVWILLCLLILLAIFLENKASLLLGRQTSTVGETGGQAIDRPAHQ